MASMQQYRHIIWDWNGTLFDDAWLCIEIINGLLARRGLPLLDAARYQELFTFPVRNFYQAAGFDFASDPFEELAAEFTVEYDRRRFECGLQPGAHTALAAFAARGCDQSVLSAYEQTRLGEMIAYTGLHDNFRQLFGLDDHYSTSKVALGRRCIRELACPPEEALLIGDSLHDFDAAKAMGITCLLIPSGHYSHARLAQCGAPVVENLEGLLGEVA